MPPRTHDASDYDAVRFADVATRRRFATMERVIHAHVAGRRPVLDLACGTGRFSVQLRVADVTGLDRSRAMLAQARRRALRVVLGDAHALPFAADRFDAVTCTDSAFATFDHERALDECARVLRPGGLLALHHPTDRIWRPRQPLRITTVPSGDPGRSGSLLLERARRRGFAVEGVWLWRWLRVHPFLVRVPGRPGWPLWNHGVFLLRKCA